MKFTFTARLAGLVAVALVAVSCGLDDDDAAAGGVASEASFDIVGYNHEDTFGGSEVSFDSLLGQGTPVILNFWAAQCPPCLAEMPWLEAASVRHDGNVTLVGVDVGPFTGLGNNEQGAELLGQLGITYPAAYAVNDEPLRAFDVFSMPTTIFFDGDGSIVDTHAGIMTEDQIEDFFTRLAEG
jgi:thiol-disulfide isomerase/thioredoxin